MGKHFPSKQFGVEEPKEHDDFLTRYIEIVKANISNPELDVSVIYEALGMSRTNFYRKVKTVTGLSPIELIKNIRLEAGAKLLKESDMNISEIAQHIGFSSRSYFARSFKAVYGMSRQNNQETNLKLRMHLYKIHQNNVFSTLYILSLWNKIHDVWLASFILLTQKTNRIDRLIINCLMC